MHRKAGPNEPKSCLVHPALCISTSFIGMHWLLNVVTGPVDYPAAVLIRAVEGINGPARLTKAMGVTGSFNGKPADEENGVWFSEGPRLRCSHITRSARIGVEYAGPV